MPTPRNCARFHLPATSPTRRLLLEIVAAPSLVMQAPRTLLRRHYGLWLMFLPESLLVLLTFAPKPPLSLCFPLY